MASNRHLGRIVALQTLYEVEFRQDCLDKTLDAKEVLERNIATYKETVDDQAFVRSLVNGVSSKIKQLDELLAPIAPEWPINQIARIDRSVLRMAVWELKHDKEVPPKVVINEAVELAKAFGGDNSSKFVNGVLGTVYKQLYPSSAKATEGKPATKKAKKTVTKKTSKKSTAKKITTKKAKTTKK